MSNRSTASSTPESKTCLALGLVEEPGAPRFAAPRPSRTPEHPRLRLPRLIRPAAGEPAQQIRDAHEGSPVIDIRDAAPASRDAPAPEPHLHVVVAGRSDDDVLPPGTRLGRYVLLGLRGEGGTCRIYDAQHLRQRHRVIARVPRREVARAHPWIAERMLTNAALLADAPHPGILSIFDFGWTDEIDPRPFMITERIVGRDLAAYVAQHGPLPWRFVVDLAIQAAEALRHFHSLGVVHGDLKPSNMMLAHGAEPSMRVKIIDPDLARRFDAPPDPGLSPGTPSYLAPEHVYGSRPSIKSDLFSFGVILYELIVGRCPIPGERRLLALHAGAPWPPLPALHAAYPEFAVPEGLSQLIGRLTSHDRSARPDSAESVLGELEALRDGRVFVDSRGDASSPQAPRGPVAPFKATGTKRGGRVFGLAPVRATSSAKACAVAPVVASPAEDPWDAASSRQPSLLAASSPDSRLMLVVALLCVGLAIVVVAARAFTADRAPKEVAPPRAGVESIDTRERESSQPATTVDSAEPAHQDAPPTAAAPIIAPPVTPAAAPVAAASLPRPAGSRRPRRVARPAPVRGPELLPSLRDPDGDDSDDGDDGDDDDGDELDAAEVNQDILAFRAAVQAASAAHAAPRPDVSAATVIVPKVTSLTIAEAERALAAVGLSVTSRGIVHPRCDGLAEGTVIAQDPSPGRRFDADLPVLVRTCGAP